MLPFARSHLPHVPCLTEVTKDQPVSPACTSDSVSLCHTDAKDLCACWYPTPNPLLSYVFHWLPHDVLSAPPTISGSINRLISPIFISSSELSCDLCFINILGQYIPQIFHSSIPSPFPPAWKINTDKLYSYH